MPLALSGGTIIYRTLTGSLATLVGNINSALVAAGWVSSTISGGFSLVGTSPQGLSVTAEVFVSSSLVWIRFRSAGGDGMSHRLNDGAPYQIVAGPCQFFISVVGNGGQSTNGSTVFGGVPYIPNPTGGTDPTCGAVGVNGDPVTEAWWAGGDWGGSVFIPAANLRQTLNQTNTTFGAGTTAEGMFNGSYCLGGVGLSRVISLSHSYGGGPLRYPNGTPLVVEPLVGWGDTNTDQLRLRGQLWDAMIVCEARALDNVVSAIGNATIDAFGFTWINFVASSNEGALYLIKSIPTSGGSNESYVY